MADCIWLVLTSSTTQTHVHNIHKHTRTDFIVTGSQDGHVKFWKKQVEGVEFVKHFRAHLGERNCEWKKSSAGERIRGVQDHCSPDCTYSSDCMHKHERAMIEGRDRIVMMSSQKAY